MPDETKTEETKTETKTEVPAPAPAPNPTPVPAPPTVSATDSDKPWTLTKAEWDAHQARVGGIEQQLKSGLSGILEPLTPLLDALKDVTEEEQKPQSGKKRNWFKRKIGG